MLIASGEPFEYPHPDWGDSIQMIGACAFDPAPPTPPEWLDAIDAPIVLVTTSSERQGDTDLATTTMLALADEPVHVVATFPAGLPTGFAVPANATAREFVSHSLVLQRAGLRRHPRRDGCDAEGARERGTGLRRTLWPRSVRSRPPSRGRRRGTRLPARKLTTQRLRVKVREAMKMTDGARRVAAGFAATGGVSRKADLVEQRLLNRPAAAPRNQELSR